MYDDIDYDINDGPKLHPKQDDDFWGQFLVAAFTSAVIICALVDPVDVEQEDKLENSDQPVAIIDKEPVLNMSI